MISITITRKMKMMDFNTTKKAGKMTIINLEAKVYFTNKTNRLFFQSQILPATPSKDSLEYHQTLKHSRNCK
ncbi:MAG: hypothetical protein ACKO96_23175 [Flammeovirgaceae bacterium]